MRARCPRAGRASRSSRPTACRSRSPTSAPSRSRRAQPSAKVTGSARSARPGRPSSRRRTSISACAPPPTSRATSTRSRSCRLLPPRTRRRPLRRLRPYPSRLRRPSRRRLPARPSSPPLRPRRPRPCRPRRCRPSRRRPYPRSRPFRPGQTRLGRPPLPPRRPRPHPRWTIARRWSSPRGHPPSTSSGVRSTPPSGSGRCRCHVPSRSFPPVQQPAPAAGTTPLAEHARGRAGESSRAAWLQHRRASPGTTTLLRRPRSRRTVAVACRCFSRPWRLRRWQPSSHSFV